MLTRCELEQTAFHMTNLLDSFLASRLCRLQTLERLMGTRSMPAVVELKHAALSKDCQAWPCAFAGMAIPQQPQLQSTAGQMHAPVERLCSTAKATSTSKPLDVSWLGLPGALASIGSSNDLFWSLFGQQEAHDTFWLDRCGLLLSCSMHACMVILGGNWLRLCGQSLYS